MHSARTGHPRSLSLSHCTLNHFLTDLPSQIVLSMPGPRKNPLFKCMCGCNHLVTQWTVQRHMEAPSPAIVQIESPPPPKQRHVAHSQADASSSSSSHPRLHPQSFEFNPSLPSLDPAAASAVPQLPGDAPSKVSGSFVDRILLNLHAWTH